MNLSVIMFLVSLRIFKRASKEKSNKNFPEILAYAFWIRKNNLMRIKKKINISGEKRLARGNVLHIPPANVPTGFLYSWTFGLVSGNKNIIKIPKYRISANRKYNKVFK